MNHQGTAKIHHFETLPVDNLSKFPMLTKNQQQNTQQMQQNESQKFLLGNKYQNFLTVTTKPKERTRVKTQIWNLAEIKKIFELYQQYGSQWKIIQSDFSDRNANSIKNRFYTVIRTVLKLLFKWNPSISQKLPHQIPSKIILKIYEGREEYVKFKGFIKKVLKMIDFNLDSKQLRKISAQNSQQTLRLYQFIYSNKYKNTISQLSNISQANKKEQFGSFTQNKANEDNQEVQRSSNQKIQRVQNLRTQTCFTTEDNMLWNNYPSSQVEGLIFYVPMQPMNYMPSCFEIPIMKQYYTTF